MGSMRCIMESGDRLLMLVCKHWRYVRNIQPSDTLVLVKKVTIIIWCLVPLCVKYPKTVRDILRVGPHSSSRVNLKHSEDNINHTQCWGVMTSGVQPQSRPIVLRLTFWSCCSIMLQDKQFKLVPYTTSF